MGCAEASLSPAHLTSKVWTRSIDEHYVRQSETLRAMPGALNHPKPAWAGIRQALFQLGTQGCGYPTLDSFAPMAFSSSASALMIVAKRNLTRAPICKLDQNGDRASQLWRSRQPFWRKKAQAAGAYDLLPITSRITRDVWLDNLKDLRPHLSNHLMELKCRQICQETARVSAAAALSIALNRCSLRAWFCPPSNRSKIEDNWCWVNQSSARPETGNSPAPRVRQKI